MMRREVLAEDTMTIAQLNTVDQAHEKAQDDPVSNRCNSSRECTRYPLRKIQFQAAARDIEIL